ncbi:BamA/TamA family outer membrane protein [Balneolaceae bacterium YR4-1]|uniref:BamA/TamA family outer membrane protein n=1 Tax=Halalkalibaculum roseum TaxID=2709311 RepID=A0A6M1SSH7_9BACT|nr:patatin-like phospholipase family protein [Halalkalibaculum roseum]NGP75712.1 BamA/TamA family outer membrane protein [Halalkalibaculum roseum]
MKLFRFLSFLLVLLLTVPFAGSAQLSDGPDTQAPRKVGIALSAGGAKGFAHIGVLKVLDEENIPIHFVTGSSMGAVIGGLYAAGYTPEQIEEIAINTDWQALFNDNLKPSSRDLSTFISTRDTYMLSFPILEGLPQLPAGLVGGQNLSMLLHRLLLPFHDTDDFSELPIPFAAIATNLSTGESRRFESGYLPEVIRASAAIPSIFKPVSIDGELYIDGGVMRSIPAEDARDMGADIVLVSDVGEPVKPVEDLNNFVDILFQSVGFHLVKSDSAQMELADFYLRPDIEAFNSFSYEEVDALIKSGEEVAHEMMPRIKAMLNSVPTEGRNEKPDISLRDREIDISSIHFDDIDRRLLNQARVIFDINPPEKIAYSEIERKINRLYATGHFSLITYRIQNDGSPEGGKSLTISFSDSQPDRLGFSMRYDTRYKASLLFGLQMRNVFGLGDQLNSNLRLGEVLGVGSHYEAPISLAPAISANADLNLYRSPIDYYESGQQLATIEIDRAVLHPYLSVRLFNYLELETGLKAEYYELSEAIGSNVLLADRQFLFSAVGKLEFNNLDRAYFSSRGFNLKVIGEASDKRYLSEATFSQVIAGFDAALPLYDGLVLRMGAMAGQSNTSSLPFHYRFYQGGMTVNPLFNERHGPLWGYAVQQLSGSSLAALHGSLQFHLGRDIFLQTGWNAAHLSDSGIWKPSDFDWNEGYGLSLGALTLIGPINFSLSTPDFKNNYAFKVEVGYSF